MTIIVPLEVPTRGIDQLVSDNADRDRLIEFGRMIEAKYERLKLVHDNLLTDTAYAPLLSAAPTDAELQTMIQEAGWVVNFDATFGTTEELAMWLNRFRRFASAVRKA